MKTDSSDECHSIANQNTKPIGTDVDETLDNLSPLRRSKRLKGLHRPDTSKNVPLCEMESDERKNTETSVKESGICESMEESCLILTPASPDEKDRGNPVHVPLKQFSEHSVISEGAENGTIHQEQQQKNSSRDDVADCPAECLVKGDDKRHSEEFMKTLSTNERKADNIVQTRLPSSDDAEEGEIFYSLWSFGKFQIFVRTSIDGRSKVQSQQDVPLYIQPKLEYQPAFGHEQLTVSEVCRGWLKLFLTPGAQLIRGRINVITSELMKLEYVDLKSILNQLVPFNPGQSMKMLHSCLKTLSCLPEGQYLLSHNASDIHACIYQSTDPAANKSCYDLHASHQKHKLGHYSPTNPPWLPLDPNLPLPQHIDESRIPATFPPEMNNISKPKVNTKGARNVSSKKNNMKLKSL